MIPETRQLTQTVINAETGRWQWPSNRTSNTEVTTIPVRKGILRCREAQTSQVRVQEKSFQSAVAEKHNQGKTRGRVVQTVIDVRTDRWKWIVNPDMGRKLPLLGTPDDNTAGSRISDVYIISDSSLAWWNSFSLNKDNIPSGINVHEPEVVSGGTIAGLQMMIINKIRSMGTSDSLLIYLGAKDARETVNSGAALPLSAYHEIINVAAEYGANVCISTVLPSPCTVRTREANTSSYAGQGWCYHSPCSHERELAGAQRVMNRTLCRAIRATSSAQYYDITSTFSSEGTMADRRHFVNNDIHLNKQGARLLSELVANNIALVNDWWN